MAKYGLALNGLQELDDCPGMLLLFEDFQKVLRGRLNEASQLAEQLSQNVDDFDEQKSTVDAEVKGLGTLLIKLKQTFAGIDGGSNDASDEDILERLQAAKVDFFQLCIQLCVT